MNNQSLTNAVKKLTGLAGAVSLSAIVGLPAVAQVNNNPSIFNEAPYKRTVSEPSTAGSTPLPGSAPLSDACTTQSSSMSSATVGMNEDTTSAVMIDNSTTNRPTVGSASYLGPDTTGTQNRAIYGINPSASNMNQSSWSNDSYRSNLGSGTSSRTVYPANTISPTSGPTGGSVLQKYHSMIDQGSNGNNSLRASADLQSVDSSNSSIYRVSPSNVGGDNQVSRVDSSSYSTSVVCQP